jgi:hypothetical protein
MYRALSAYAFSAYNAAKFRECPDSEDFASFAVKDLISAAIGKDKILNRKVRQGFRKGRKETEESEIRTPLKFLS